MDTNTIQTQTDIWRWLRGESGLLYDFDDKFLEYGSVKAYAAALEEQTFYADWKPHVEAVLFDHILHTAEIWIQTDCENLDIHAAWSTHELIRIIADYDPEVGAELRSDQRERYRQAMDVERSRSNAAEW